MDFEKLKKMALETGGLLVLEGERPDFVILPYAKYQELEAAARTVAPAKAVRSDVAPKQKAVDEATIDQLNKEIEALKEQANALP